MRVTVVLEHRFERTPDGVVWSSAGFDARFWEAYLGVFNEVRIVGRVKDVPEPSPKSSRTSGAGIRVEGIPYYVGPAQFALRSARIRAAASRIARASDAYILRVPSPVGGMIIGALQRRRHPYAVEVVGDPYDVFSPGTVRHPLRGFFRWWTTAALRKHCHDAFAASYVTRTALQRRYPCRSRMFAISDIRLTDDAFCAEPRVFRQPAKRIVFVGTLELLYKAPDVLIEAVARLVSEGHDIELFVVGDGRERPNLARIPGATLLGSRLRFLGWLPPGSAVRSQLDSADIFVLPSRQEGLPRAMVEAMARGLPCIGSTAGGMYELLPSEYLVRPGDVLHLASVLRDLLRDPTRLSASSSRNLDVAHEYAASRLTPQRTDFYDFVRSHTATEIQRLSC